MTAVVTKDPRVQLLFHRVPPARRAVESFAELRGVLVASGGVLQAAPAFDILSFVGPSPLEIGANLVTPAFTATYSLPPNNAVLSDSEGNPSKNVFGSPESFSSDETFTKTQPLDEVGFTLTAQGGDGGGAKQAGYSVAFWPRIFVGTDTPLNLGEGDEAFIEALALSQLQGSAAGSFGLTVPVGERIFFALPDSFDTSFEPIFQIGSDPPGGFTAITAAINVTASTPNAVPVPYTLYQSNAGGFGATTLTVTDGA